MFKLPKEKIVFEAVSAFLQFSKMTILEISDLELFFIPYTYKIFV